MIGSSFISELSARQYHNNKAYPSKPLIPHLLPHKFSVIDRNSKGLFCGEFAKDGKYFISSCQSGCITVYVVQPGYFKKVHTYWSRQIQWSIIDTKLSPDSRYIAYSSWMGTVNLIPFLNKHNTSETRLFLTDPSAYLSTHNCAFSISFSQDSKELIAGTDNGKTCVFDIETSTKVVNIEAHLTDVNSVSFTNNTNHIIYSGADDGVLKIWDRRILSEANPKPVSVFVGHAHGITYHDSKGDFRYIITNSKDQTIKLWDTRRPSLESDIKPAEDIVRLNYLFWDYREVRPYHNLAGQHTFLKNIRNQFDKVTKDDSVATYTGHSVSKTLIRARFSPAYSTLQQYIYTGSANGKLYIYDINSGEVVYVSDSKACHGDVVRDVSWHPTEPVILTSSLDASLGCTQLRDVRVLRDCEETGHEEDMSDGSGGGSEYEEDELEYVENLI